VILRLKSSGFIVGGCLTSERREKGARVGFDVRDLTDGRMGELASTSRKLGPRVGKYRVNLQDLAGVGASGLMRAALSSEVIVIDEVGPMELVSPEFRKAVRACIDSGKPILAVVHERIEDDLLAELKSKSSETLELSVENREGAANAIVDGIAASLGPPKPS